MKAVVYKGARKVAIEDVPDAKVQGPLDAVIRLTSTNICGSDLHMYEGRTEAETGMIFGHENMGIVEAVGAGVERIKVGDRVSVPFNVACGTCANCNNGWTSFCQRVNPTEGMDGGAYGFAGVGPYDGGQAELLRVPYADFNLLNLPEGKDHELDYTMLSDIFPTGYHGTELAGVAPGDTVTIMGAGPVGLMAAHSAFIRGASQVFVVDQHKDRLNLATKFGATAINFADGDPVEQIMTATSGIGTDRGVEAVGYQAHDHSGEEHPELTIDNLVDCVRATGGIGVVGVYLKEDPGAKGDLAKQGRVPMNFGSFWMKGQTIATGQCPTKRYNAHLRDLITAGRANPSLIVSHEINLDQAPEAYESFDKREDGYTKVVIHP